MAQTWPPLHMLSQLSPMAMPPFAYDDAQPPVAIPQRVAAPFYNLPPLAALLQPGVADAVNIGAADPDLGVAMPRNFDSLYPGRESANVEDRRGRFDDLMYAKELEQEFEKRRSAAATPLMRRR